MPVRQEYFKILGLDEPPTDRKTVKRAYSKMLKLTRPEDDPEGFMRLRDAHDQALNILKWRAEEREWETKQAKSDLTPPEQTPETIADEPNSEIKTPADSSLTYSDMLPGSEPESDTSYSLRPTPNFDAPVTLHEFSKPAFKPVIEKLETMLQDPKRYNDREEWNILFRAARQLDIDDYVDFENTLLESVLRFHGYFENHPNHNIPHKMPIKLSPSLAASLFKTMSWDQVKKRGQYRAEQIDWLERRMHLRKRGVDPVPVPQPQSESNAKIWLWIFGIFIALKIIQALAHL